MILIVKHEERDFTDAEFKEAYNCLVANLQYKKLKCASCGKETYPVQVDMYDHEYGTEVVTDWPKQWVSIHCVYCGYDTSFNKLKEI